MELAVRPVCLAEGCGTKLRSGNAKRGTCDRHDRLAVPRGSDKAEVSPWESCEKGHVLNRTGYTKKKTCFECALFRARCKPAVRFFFLHKFKEARGTKTITEIAKRAGIPQSVVSGYAYGLAMAPEERVERIAEALGVSEDELKGVS